jgi:hypothetical protein
MKTRELILEWKAILEAHRKDEEYEEEWENIDGQLDALNWVLY